MEENHCTIHPLNFLPLRQRTSIGLAILDLEEQNKCLLSKWLFNLINRDGAWQQLLRNKYLSNKSITQVSKRPGDSRFWSRLMNLKDQFLSFGDFRLQSGNQIRSWEDIWLGPNTLRENNIPIFIILFAGKMIQ
jgi:hypothetical protein